MLQNESCPYSNSELSGLAVFYICLIISGVTEGKGIHPPNPESLSFFPLRGLFFNRSCN